MTEGDTVLVHVQLTLEDSAAFQRICADVAAATRPHPRLTTFAGIFLGLSFALVPISLAVRGNWEWSIAFGVLMLIGILPVCLLWYDASRKIANRMYDPKGSFLRPHDVSVSSQGVWFKNDVFDLRYDWRAFLRAEETPTHFFIYVDKLMAHVVPKREFGSTEDADRFGAMLRANIKPAEPSA